MATKHKIQRVWVDDTRVYALTEDGLQASYPFSMWKRLAKATPEQRQNFYLSYAGIHWPDIDEDLSFEGICSRCGGSGYLPRYNHVEGGRCFKCNGEGVYIPDVF